MTETKSTNMPGWLNRYFKVGGGSDTPAEPDEQSLKEKLFRIVCTLRGRSRSLDKHLDHLTVAMAAKDKRAALHYADAALQLSEALGSSYRAWFPSSDTRITLEAFVSTLRKLPVPSEKSAKFQSLLLQIEQSDDATVNHLLNDLASFLAHLTTTGQAAAADGYALLWQDLFQRLSIRRRYNHELDAYLSEKQQQLEGIGAAGTAQIIFDMLGIANAGAQQLHSKISIQQDRILSEVTQLRQLVDDQGADQRAVVRAIGNRLERLQTEVERTSTWLEQTASGIDLVTRLPNRYECEERLQQAWLERRHFGGEQAIIAMNIDAYDLIIDYLGDASGNLLLRQIANIVKEEIKPKSFVARYADARFVFFLRHASVTDALLLSNFLRKKIEKSHFRFHNTRIPVSASCGIAQFNDQDTAESVLQRAFDALADAVNLGGNQSKTEQQPHLEATKLM